MKLREKLENKKIPYLKILIAAVALAALFLFAFTTQVREGNGAIILRFGAPRKIAEDAGLYFKLPWPFESVASFDKRKQYLESNYLETITRDNRNVLLQSYAVWSVADPLLYYNSVGAPERAESYIKDQIFSATNSTIGAYDLAALVSLDKEKINTEEIQDKIFSLVRDNCEKNYGIAISDVNILRISLPDKNLESVFEQMTADRQKEIDTILANAQRDANKIKTDADAEAAEIIAAGQIEAAEIKAKTEKEVAEIYASAQQANIELYKFLQELDTLAASVNENSVLVVTADSYPFNVLLKYSDASLLSKDDEVTLRDLNYIMSKMSEKDAAALTDYIYALLEQAKVV